MEGGGGGGDIRMGLGGDGDGNRIGAHAYRLRKKQATIPRGWKHRGFRGGSGICMWVGGVWSGPMDSRGAYSLARASVRRLPLPPLRSPDLCLPDSSYEAHEGCKVCDTRTKGVNFEYASPPTLVWCDPRIVALQVAGAAEATSYSSNSLGDLLVCTRGGIVGWGGGEGFGL